MVKASGVDSATLEAAGSSTTPEAVAERAVGLQLGGTV